MVVRKTAKLFTNGRSQAVRLPREFRFPGKEVAIRRDPASGDVLLSPLEKPEVQPESTGAEEQGKTPAERRLTLQELFAIFDQAEWPEGFFEREKEMPRELDLF